MLIRINAKIVLANEGTTQYEIVRPSDPSPIDSYAISELAEYLKQITGATFPVVDASDINEEKHQIFIGDSEASRSRFGQSIFNNLSAQEWRVRSKKQDLLLLGEGLHGVLSAVYGFLRTLGWEWASLFEYPSFATDSKLTIRLQGRSSTSTTIVKPSVRRGNKPSFLYRSNLVKRASSYYYANGINMDFGRWKAERIRGGSNMAGLDVYEPIFPEVEGFAHNLFDYIPPSSTVSAPYSWIASEQRNMFAANPTWFSQINGVRVSNRQLNFGNTQLRAELTARIKQNIVRLGGGEMLMWLAAMDVPGGFCESSESQALVSQYNAPCGPIIDYLIELCNDLAVTHPGVKIRTLAYRKGQTQEPPALPLGQKLPANLLIEFAAIDDNYFGDWSMDDADLQQTYSDLQGWSAIVHSPENLLCWMYPNAYGTGTNMPVGNIEKVATQMKLMHSAGVRGIYLDHNGLATREQFAELQQFMVHRLLENINQSVTGLIDKGTNFLYGPASDPIKTYLFELEQERKAMQLPAGVRWDSNEVNDATFPYLTVQNIHRWQGYFEQALSLASGQPENIQGNVKRARRELDYATLWKWQQLKAAYPGHAYYESHVAVSERINALLSLPNLPPTTWEASKSVGSSQGVVDRTPATRSNFMSEDFVTLIEVADDSPKPLPSIPGDPTYSQIERLIPKYPWRQSGPTVVKDSEAWLSYGCPVHQPRSPFTFGFWDATALGGLGNTVITRSISSFPSSGYTVFDIGADVTLSSSCNVWFSTASRRTVLDVSHLHIPGGNNVWRIYASIKFNGPTYASVADQMLLPNAKRLHGGTNPTDLVLIDQVILGKV
jgi:hypothetical protein